MRITSSALNSTVSVVERPRSLVDVEGPPSAVDLGVVPNRVGLQRIEVLPDRLLLYADDGEAVLEEIHRQGLNPVTQLVRRSSLEDVFLRLTGRSLVD